MNRSALDCRPAGGVDGTAVELECLAWGRGRPLGAVGQRATAAAAAAIPTTLNVGDTAAVDAAAAAATVSAAAAAAAAAVAAAIATQPAPPFIPADGFPIPPRRPSCRQAAPGAEGVDAAAAAQRRHW